MHQIKRIIELQQQGRSIRQTVRLTGLSRNTIREYLRRISSTTKKKKNSVDKALD